MKGRLTTEAGDPWWHVHHYIIQLYNSCTSTCIITPFIAVGSHQHDSPSPGRG